jgi:hypothetical protein
MIIGAVAIDVDDVGKVVGVRDKGFCHEAMHLKVLTSETDTAIAFTVERCYLLTESARTRWRTIEHSGCRS